MAAKLAKAKKEKENTGKLVVTSFLEYLCALWALVFVVAVPLYMKDGYYQIGVAKYNAYAHVVVFGFPVLLLLVFLYAVFSVKEKGITLQGIKSVGKSMSATDMFVIAYMVFVLISFFTGGYMKEAFWGYDGWYMGLFSQLTFVLIYFVFSRFLKDYPLVVTVLCATAMYVFTIGVLHRLEIDPIGVYSGLSIRYKSEFLSTLGQASWYSGFLMAVLPMGMFAFWYFKHALLRVISGIFTLVGFMSLVTQNSDSAYLGLVVAFLVLFHVSVEDAKKMCRFFETLFLFAISPKVFYALFKLHPNTFMQWDKISTAIIVDAWMWYLMALCIVFAAVIRLAENKKMYSARIMRMVRNVVYGIFGGAILACVFILLGSAKGWLPTGMMSVTGKIPYLRWNESWGNGRGFTWSFTAKMLDEMNWKNKLLGVGPDCYALYGHGNYNDLIAVMWHGAVLNNAHNEWFNMFVNMGFFGGIAYLGIFVSALVRFAKKCDKRPVLIGFAACIAAYMAHNVFCYQQVLCTPFVFLFMALGEYQIRKKTE